MLRVHFLNVGHGDCTVLSHPSGRMTMIDINNSQDYDPDSFQQLVDEQRQKAGVSGLSVPAPGALSGLSLSGAARDLGLLGGTSLTDQARAAATGEIQDPIAFMQSEYRGKRLWRFILTHPDLDHMRGLKNLYETIGFNNFWDTDHGKPTPDFKSYSDRADWEFYQALRKGHVAGVSVLRFIRGHSAFAFAREENGLPGGDRIEILSPSAGLMSASNAGENWNDLSIALRVWHANRSVLLPGDAEAGAWKEMATVYGAGLKSDYLKASHHGRDSGFDLEALKLIAPAVTFVSVGRKPDTDASSKYRQQCNRVASTRYHGNMEVRFFDDGTTSWFVDRNGGK